MNFSKERHRPCGNSYTDCHMSVLKKDGGKSVVAKKRSAIGTFF
jgi:hypothetical protein